jgi:hypothetical protein
MTKAEKREFQYLKEKIKILERRIRMLEDCQKIERQPYHVNEFLKTSPVPGPGDYPQPFSPRYYPRLTPGDFPWSVPIICSTTSEETK